MINTVIIGGGSTGLYLAKLLEENKISYKILEGFKEAGGQCVVAYPEKNMYDIPSISPISGKGYIDLLLQYINKENLLLETKYITHHKKENNIWSVDTTKGCFECKNLVFATGVGMNTYNKPLVENLEQYENKQIFFFPKYKENYKDKRIVVFGGGDSAFDAIELLLEVTNNITLVHRRNQFNSMERKINNLFSKIKTYIPFNLKSLNGSKDLLESVSIYNPKDNQITTIEADYVFFCYGYNTADKVLFPVNIKNMKNLTGLFAIGPAGIYKNKRNLITSSRLECRIVLNNLEK